MSSISNFSKDEVLEYHYKNGQNPGKVGVSLNVPLLNQRDLSMAYSPGVSLPCMEIYKRNEDVYKYTSKGNTVAVITNGTAVLGLGDIGPAASKPVMEGKCALFKKFADIDAVDVEIKTKDVDSFISIVENIGDTWGGINLEDIASPGCFIIEERLRKSMDIPVFHDDQHGTAIVVAAALMNALDITGRKMSNIKVVVSGAGAAAISCINLIKFLGVQDITVCDKIGVIYKTRIESMNPWKESLAVETKCRNMEDALRGADVFLGLSAGNIMTEKMLRNMNPAPIVFAMANPDPEVDPALVRSIHKDSIIATGRSDYNNQVNNAMCFPYIFRGALDIRANTINEEMKIAAAYAIAQLAKQPVSEEVLLAYSGKPMSYGPEYIIPTLFDPRLITTIPVAVAKAACETGVSKLQSDEAYSSKLKIRSYSSSNAIVDLDKSLRNSKKKIIFSEGEEEQSIRCAMQWRENEYGVPVLVGVESKILSMMDNIGISNRDGLIIHNAAKSEKNDIYVDFLYKALQREGFLHRSCVRNVKTDRNSFSACMLMCGDGDIMLTGLTRNYFDSLNQTKKIIGVKDVMFGIYIISSGKKTIFLVYDNSQQRTSSEKIASISISAAERIKRMGLNPNVAFISSSSFGSLSCGDKMRDAVNILKNSNVTFNFDGEICVDVVFNNRLLGFYPFHNFGDSQPNVLVLPNMESASIATGLLGGLSDVSIVGPIVAGMNKPAQILEMTSEVQDILNIAMFGSLLY